MSTLHQSRWHHVGGVSVVLAGLCVAAGAGCQRTAAPVAVPAPDVAAKSKEGRYPLRGVVRSIDRESGLVAIRHDPIPGVMPQMTMSFPLEGEEVFDSLQVGDTVTGTLVMGEESSQLEAVEIVALADPEQALEERRAAARLAPGALVPDFVMTTQTGERLRLEELRGKVVALTFIYTRCPLPDYCPAVDKRFAELARRLRAAGLSDRTRLLSVSFDPEHDTPEALDRHAELLRAEPPLWTFAVASHHELKRVAEPLGLVYGPGQNEIIHSLSTALIDAEGRLVRLELGNKWTVDAFVSAIRAALRAR